MKKNLAICPIFLFSLAVNTVCFAQYQFTIVPSITVSETYDDNLFLANVNEVDDYITTVAPGIALGYTGEHTNLNLTYIPKFVRYSDRDDLNTTRHSANLSFGQDVTQFLRFDLVDSYLRSDDPIEDVEDVQGLRTTRNKYWRNFSQASLGYLFGTENKLRAGYGLTYIENEDPRLDDSNLQNPFAALTYWYDVKNGMSLNYKYTQADFSRDDNLLAKTDFTGHGAGARYIRRFNPKTQAYIQYNYTTRDFEGTREDFVVHDSYVGVDHSFSPEYSMSGGAGYFLRHPEISEDQDGFTYFASLTRTFPSVSITLGGAGGWSEDYISQETSGFTKYYSGYVRGKYHLLEPLQIYAGASYRRDKEVTDRKWDSFRGNVGLEWSFLRWFALSLDYSYAQRDDDVNTEDFKNNRVALILTASKPYKW